MIRLAEENDYDRMVDIWLDASIKAHHFIPEGYWKDGASEMKEIYLPQSRSWVYEDETGLVQGFVSLLDNHIAALFVATSQQGNGLGSRLLRFVKTKSRQLTLNVYAENTSAVDFYRHHGFQVDEELIDEATSAKDLKMNWNSSLL
ncbi:N-acetyltransferase [Sphingobacterium tabacisoli]|uniref:N-acetyltransferase n=1 Tax=Sphingobacterium tabacisoli TaxID=2044855 RepID=A0ABW5L2V4_9SPHI|nr:N-acetyltransferase [Sphingobacterium tabacisoli]